MWSRQLTRDLLLESINFCCNFWNEIVPSHLVHFFRPAIGKNAGAMAAFRNDDLLTCTISGKSV